MPPIISGATAVQGIAGLITMEGTRELAGMEFADFSGGLVATGSAYYDEMPRWQPVDPFSIGTTTVTQQRFVEITGVILRRREFDGHPAVMVSWKKFDDFYWLMNRGLGRDLVRFPTSLEWTAAARVPVNVRELLEQEGIRQRNLPDVANNWLELFFTEPGGTIYTDPRSEAFKRVVNSVAPLFAYYVYGTPSGMLGEPGQEAWYDQRETAPVKGRRPNGHGLYDVTGNVWELVGDGTEWRGGSYEDNGRWYLRVACRYRSGDSHVGADYFGSRPVALRQDLRK